MNGTLYVAYHLSSNLTLLLNSKPLHAGEDGICRADCSANECGKEVCRFTVGVNLFASDLRASYFE